MHRSSNPPGPNISRIVGMLDCAPESSTAFGANSASSASNSSIGVLRRVFGVISSSNGAYTRSETVFVSGSICSGDSAVGLGLRLAKTHPYSAQNAVCTASIAEGSTIAHSCSSVFVPSHANNQSFLRTVPSNWPDVPLTIEHTRLSSKRPILSPRYSKRG